ncbi:MAG TPA: chromosomal replication initiator protein DnaA [Candidatus Magasanikbacteria bacterium]|nr:chromosomal replication initiator protein DnaA [Candidatus Magasanikbacteria bacterium]
MTNYEIWQAILAEFELKLTKANFTTWFKSTGISSINQGQVIICVPNNFTKTWLEKKYHTEIIKALEKVTGKPIKKIEYKVENIKNIEVQECNFAQPPSAASPQNSTQSPNQTMRRPQAPTPPISPNAVKFGLNPKYSFENFIVGKGSELAHAAAEAVANRPGEAYNPLFIYGGVGLGKTHLIQAIGHSILTKNPNAKILYVSSEKFTNEFVTAVKEGRAKEFKDRYRNVDLLLIDDIQFIGGKEQTQEEFFHTFNELHQQGKQVVMTSDRPPKAILSLEDRLRSRFEWGMIADISAPDMETRVAILQSKCQEKQFNLPPNIIQLIASTISSNIRELEGALNKLIAFHQLKNIPPTEESVHEILLQMEIKDTKRSLTPKEVIQAVAAYYGLSFEDLTGKSREKRLANPRQISMFILREDLKLSYPAIGEVLGGRDHTTAMHAYSKILQELNSDQKLKTDMEALKQRLYVNNNT